MSFVHEVVFTGDGAVAERLSSWFNSSAVQNWRGLPGLSALDVYRPLVGGARDPFNDDKNGPLLIAMPEFRSADALMAAHAALEQSLASHPAGIGVTVSGLERKFYPVTGETSPAPLSAPFSYVVRYHRPAEDEAAFVKNYVETHPGTLATLPRIRSVMCYFPVDAASAGRFPPADYMIGNEVVFDTVEDFNAAMQSPVRQELRAHYHAFPKFTGLNTHFPMNRTRLAG